MESFVAVCVCLEQLPAKCKRHPLILTVIIDGQLVAVDISSTIGGILGMIRQNKLNALKASMPATIRIERQSRQRRRTIMTSYHVMVDDLIYWAQEVQNNDARWGPTPYVPHSVK